MVVFTYKGMLFSLKRGGNSDTHYYLDKPSGHHAKWKSQSEKDKYWMTPFMWGTQSSQIDRESRLVVAKGQKSGGGKGV